MSEYVNTDQLTEEESDYIFNMLQNEQEEEEVYFPELDDLLADI